MTLLSLSSQSPTHVDLGQGDESIYIWDNPLYLIPIVVIIALLILFVWIKKKR